MPTWLTMFEKIWSRHVVAEGPGGQTLLYIDRHLLHEGASAAFERLASDKEGKVKKGEPERADDGEPLTSAAKKPPQPDYGNRWGEPSKPVTLPPPD